MSESELQDLWSFSLTAVEHFVLLIRDELTRVASQEKSEILLTALDTILYETVGEDSASLAAKWLSELLGGDTLLDSLEETDRDLVLIPVDESSRHLIMW
jgi:hypothetical protein